MNLIEVIKEYKRILKLEGRISANQWLHDAVDPELHTHIQDCFK